MESSKQSNKISDIVRLKQRLKKWRDQAHNAQTDTSYTAINNDDSSNNGNSNSNNNSNIGNNSSNTKKGSLSRSNSIKGITFLKRRTLSFADFSFNSGVPSNGFPPMDEARSNNSNSTSSSSSNSNSSNSKSNGSKGITFLKRTLSFTDISSNSGVPNNGFPPRDEARSNNSNNNSSSNNTKSNSSKGINFLKRTLSFTDVSPVSNNNVPKGFLAVHVGVEMKRFVIPTNYLTYQAFCVLLKEAEEEFGFQQEGVLRIPCEVEVFEGILRSVEEKNSSKSSNAKQGYQFNRNDGIVCGSIQSPSLSQSHRPPSPMCR